MIKDYFKTFFITWKVIRLALDLLPNLDQNLFRKIEIHYKITEIKDRNMESRVVTIDWIKRVSSRPWRDKNSTREIIAKISPSQKFNASFIVLFRLANTYHKGISAALNSERLLKISTVSNIVPFCANTLLCSGLWIIPTDESTNETIRSEGNI